MSKEKLVLWMGGVALLLSVALLMMATGVLAAALGLLAGGLLLFVLALFVPLALFTAAVAKRLDTLAETGNDLELFRENGRRAAREAREREGTVE